MNITGSEEVMFCIKCGKEIDDSVQFCQYCGQQVNGAVQQPQPQQVIIVKKDYEPKSQFIAILLCLFLGLLGIHDFYLKRNGQAIAKLLITVLLGWCGIGLVITGIWCLIDFVVIIARGYDALMTEEELNKNSSDKAEYEKLKSERREQEIQNGNWK